MEQAKRELVLRRANGCCEYCRIPQAGHVQQFSIDHVIARKHGGDDSTDNLALCCLRCNLHKGTDLSSVDPAGRSIVLLFNPRTDNWHEHFRWNQARIDGLTATGRATAKILRFDDVTRLSLRQVLMKEGLMAAE